MFGDKEFGNLGYPTPEDIPVECAYRLAKLPSSAAWLAVFMGMLEQGLDEANWQQFEGGITREQAAAVWADIIDGMYAGAEAGVVVDVRQNTLNPCLLEKTMDGTTWVTFADTSLCSSPPLAQYGPTGRLQFWNGFGYFDVPDGPWVDQPPQDYFTGLQPSGPQLTQTNNQCVAAANAGNVLYQLFLDIGNNLIGQIPDNPLTTGVAAFGGDTALGLLFGAAVVPFVDFAIALFFAGYQALFEVTDFSGADRRKLICLINAHMSGSAGAWVLDWSAIRAGLATSGISSDVQNLLRQELDLIGYDGLQIAAKTTAIATYSCSAYVDTHLFYQLKATVYTQSVNYSASVPDPLDGQQALVRMRALPTWATGATGAAIDDNSPLPAAYVSGNAGSGQVHAMDATHTDIWWYNNAVYGTSAAALAAIRAIMADATYTPSSLGGTSSQNNLAGSRIAFPGHFNGITVNHYQQFQWDVYTATTYAAC